MQKIFLSLLIMGFMGTLVFGCPQTSSEDSDGEKDEFWPPDMVPHPRPPEQPADDGWAGPHRD